MSEAIGVLGYFGPEKPRGRTLLGTCGRVIANLLTLTLLLIVIVIRAAILLSGFACLFVGTLLLTVGGRRSAAEKLAQWRGHAAEKLKLWIADILRPLWRQHKHPLRVLPA